MWLACLLASVFLAWLVQTMVFRRNWKKGLDVSVSFASSSIFEGESSTLSEVVTNNKRLPIVALSVRLSFSRNLEFVRAAKENAGISDQTYKRDIFSLLPRQKITRRLSFAAKKRGYYAIEDADICAYDYFFHKGFYISFPQAARLYVYPAPVDTSRIQLISRAISGMMASRSRLYPDPFAFAGIREYRRGDPMNRINWKALARSGELMVNQFDATTEYHVTILLDLDDPYILKYEALVEESIRITAGLAAQLLRANMPVQVLSNCASPHDLTASGVPAGLLSGTDIPGSSSGRNPLHIEISATSGNITSLLQVLARIDTSQICTTMDALISAELASMNSEEIYIVISKNCTPELTASLVALQKAGNTPLLVCPVMCFDTDNRMDGYPVPLLYWDVER